MNSSQISARRSSWLSDPLWQGAKSALLVVALICASGCVSVQIIDSDGRVRTIQQAGFLKVQMEAPDQAIVGSLSGFGVIGAPLGWSVGYTRQRSALIGDGCRAVVWVTPGIRLDEDTRSELGQVAGVCLLEDGATSLSTTLTEATP